MNLIDIPLLILAVPATLACAYLAGLTLLSGRSSKLRGSSRRLRFQLIVPAHNEESGIAATIESLQKLDWPAEQFRICVIADNCTDSTADRARLAGAEVIERTNPRLRGKGHALDRAFRDTAADNWADAFVVVDADTQVSSNLLEAFAVRLEQGAQAVQGCYDILNPLASWRTRLIAIASASFHTVRSRARERMQLSCGIRGNGWCVTPSVLQQVPYRAYSLTEDIEYGIALGLAGHRVHYADEAHTYGEMALAGKVAGKQRQRWEDGRRQLVRTQTLPLLREALLQRSCVCLDLALDLIVPPLSLIALIVGGLLLLAGVGVIWAQASLLWLALASACAASLMLYVLRGWQLSGQGMQGLVALARAPLFVLWKLGVMLSRRTTHEWVGTKRNPS